MLPNINRRRLLQSCSIAATASCVLESSFASQTKNPEILFTLKGGMVKLPDSGFEEKFRLVKEIGFDAIEVDFPGANPELVKAASEASGLHVDGSVCSTHWNIRHSSPEADKRAKALEHLQTALRNTKIVGGDTVLLVVGSGADGPEDEIWERSIENIKQAVPLAEELDVKIAIENVWNRFLYDHNGDSNQSADKFVRYVDEFDSGHVGMQFDIGNHWKYGNTGDWIRTLGKRVIKLDSKGFSREKNKFTKIGEGDIDWKDVRTALGEIGFRGYCAAEVGGGGKERLTEVLANMRRTLG